MPPHRWEPIAPASATPNPKRKNVRSRVSLRATKRRRRSIGHERRPGAPRNTTLVCSLRGRQASIGPGIARNTPLGSEHAPQAQAEPAEMRRQQTRVVPIPLARFGRAQQAYDRTNTGP
jgi:hypothetical protein